MSKKITFSLEISDEDFEKLLKTSKHMDYSSIEDLLKYNLWNSRCPLVDTDVITSETVVIEWVMEEFLVKMLDVIRHLG